MSLQNYWVFSCRAPCQASFRHLPLSLKLRRCFLNASITCTLGCTPFLHAIYVKWLQFAACHSHFGVLLTSQAVSAQAEDLLAAEALQRAARAAASSSPTTGEEESSNSMVSLWAGKNALVIAQGFMFLLWACLLCDILLRVTFDRSHKCKVFVKLQCSDLWIHLSPNKFEWKWTKILLPCHRRHSTKKLPEVRTPESPPPFASHMPQDSLAAKALASHVSEQVPWVLYSGVILGRPPAELASFRIQEQHHLRGCLICLPSLVLWKSRGHLGPTLSMLETDGMHLLAAFFRLWWRLSSKHGCTFFLRRLFLNASNHRHSWLHTVPAWYLREVAATWSAHLSSCLGTGRAFACCWSSAESSQSSSVIASHDWRRGEQQQHGVFVGWEERASNCPRLHVFALILFHVWCYGWLASAQSLLSCSVMICERLRRKANFRHLSPKKVLPLNGSRHGHKLYVASLLYWLSASPSFKDTSYIHWWYIHFRCHGRLEYKFNRHPYPTWTTFDRFGHTFLLLRAIPADFLHIDIVSNFFGFCHIHLQAQDWGMSCTFPTTPHSPFFAGTSSTTNISYLDTFWRTLRNHFHAPACIPADFFCIDIVSEYNSLASSHSTTKSLDHGGSLALLLGHRNPFFGWNNWNELSSSFWTAGHVMKVQFQLLWFSRVLAKGETSARIQLSFLVHSSRGSMSLTKKNRLNIYYIHWRCATGPNFWRAKTVLSFHTGFIPTTTKASRGRQWRAGRPRSVRCAHRLLSPFFPLFSKVRDKWSRTLLCVTAPISFWLPSPLF